MVAWLRHETQSLLTIQKHLVQKNSHLSVKNPDYRHWNLHIHDVQESDRGGYMCQVNTVPMKSLVGFLDVVVPPSFLDSETSSEVLAREGTNITLSCRVRGHPTPTITWRREDGQTLMTNICQHQTEGRCQNAGDEAAGCPKDFLPCDRTFQMECPQYPYIFCNKFSSHADVERKVRGKRIMDPKAIPKSRCHNTLVVTTEQ
ncbi:ig-like domain-containing protein [Trichonephila inaurata madagascariensis]|uniref:Ig-like domain-containing protein n=1 Tax=Trichonephila inaurata madagascariensis TaxID=2747483 RepID=A0A8X7C4M3_9ARAC|nr:ig-like domain-containing protein [Trichonephila inaurata madagascariensis]